MDSQLVHFCSVNWLIIPQCAPYLVPRDSIDSTAAIIFAMFLGRAYHSGSPSVAVDVAAPSTALGDIWWGICNWQLVEPYIKKY
jgi:hypothetical protein